MLTLKSLQNQSESWPDIGGLIMIDCWPHNSHDSHLGLFYQKMLPVLDRFNFQKIVSACYAHDTYGIGLLSPIMRDHLKTKCEIVDITDEKIFLDKNQTWQIKNWLIVGLSWQICFHTRPMGLANLARVCKWEEFYIHQDCVLTRDLDTLTVAEVRSDELVWQIVDDQGYRLVK